MYTCFDEKKYQCCHVYLSYQSFVCPINTTCCGIENHNLSMEQNKSSTSSLNNTSSLLEFEASRHCCNEKQTCEKNVCVNK